MVGSEGNMSPKNPVTPPGIDPETVRLVAQRLNHYATPGPNSPLRNSSNVLDNTRLSELHITYINLKLCIVLKGGFFPSHTMEAYRESRVVASLIHKLSPRWR